MDGIFPGRPQSLRHQRRPVDDYSPGRGGMTQKGGTRGGTFDGEMDCCRKDRTGLRHAVACPQVTGVSTCGANLYTPGGCRVVFFWCYVCFVLFCFVFVFRFFSFNESVVLRSIVLRASSIYMRPAATRSYHCLRPFFVSLDMPLYRSVFVWRVLVRRTFSPSG